MSFWCHNTVGPTLITEKVGDFKTTKEKVKDIFEAKEKTVPASLGFSTENCPPGLEFLLTSNTITMEMIDKGCLCCADRFFQVYKDDGEKVLRTRGACCDCGFTATYEHKDQLVLHTRRPTYCMLSYCADIGVVCDKGLRVEAPKGNLLGFVTTHIKTKCCAFKDCSDTCSNGTGCCPNGVMTRPIYFVMDPGREIMLTINEEVDVWCGCPQNKTKCCACEEETVFTIRVNDDKRIGAGTLIGMIKRTICKCTQTCTFCCCCKTPKYEVTWPDDLDVRMKVLLMTAVPQMEPAFFSYHSNC